MLISKKETSAINKLYSELLGRFDDINSELVLHECFMERNIFAYCVLMEELEILTV